MKRISHIIFLSFFLFSTLALSGETVKAGYVVYQGYQEGGENEYKTGFGYEYLQKLVLQKKFPYKHHLSDYEIIIH